MDHFQDIFQQAVLIKNGQMLSRRQKFESQPIFIKAGLFYLHKFENVRKQNFNQKIIVCEYLKENGNFSFKMMDFEKSCHSYEQSLSIFRFITNSNKNWKNEGIIDEDLRYLEENGENSEEIEKIKRLKISIYLNLSLSYMKMKKFGYSIMASEEALILNGDNTKALYRKAKARISDINAGIAEYDIAMKDLEKAHKIDPDDNIIKEEMIKVNEEIKKMRFLEKKNSFSGIFNKNHNFSKNCDQNGEIKEKTIKNNDKNKLNPAILDYNLSYEVDPMAKVPLEINELGNFLHYKGPQIIKLYEATGKMKEAEELKEKLKTALAAKDQLEKIASLDFNKPTTHLKEMAEKLNIDLFDPSIKNELLKVQAQNIIDLRRWLDEVNKYHEKNEKIEKSDKIEKKSEKIEKITKKSDKLIKNSLIQEKPTQIGNNYYINNNFYGALSGTDDKSSEKGEICKKCEKKSQEMNKLGSLLNYFIIILALFLIILSVIFQCFSD